MTQSHEPPATGEAPAGPSWAGGRLALPARAPRRCPQPQGTTMSNGQLKDPDDFFAETRMSFGDHIEELRTHLWRAIYGFLIALFFSFFIGKYVMNLITAPVKAQLDRFYDRRIAKVLREKNEQY